MGLFQQTHCPYYPRPYYPHMPENFELVDYNPGPSIKMPISV